jgi:thiosulfate/3-mercaptopyruvate sulfurtransferase
MTPLVSTEWLAEHLTDPDLLVFDATYYLPAEGKDAEAEFLKAHVPGAARFDIDAIKDVENPLPHMVPTPARFAAMVGALGISNASRLVFYNQSGLNGAMRGWWLMRLFGHDEAAVLDGGLTRWIAEKHPVQRGPAVRSPKASFQPDYRPGLLRGLSDMADNLATKTELVLDARSAARFHAEVPEPRAGLRAGHIPGAHSLPAPEMVGPNGLMLPPEALRAKFAAAGVDGSRPVVTSCGSGVSATLLTLGMVVAGLPMGAVYDGSWTEWGGTDLPVET